MSDISSIKLPNNSSYNVKAKKIFYAECSTARNVVAKVVACSNFVLEPGAMVAIRFTDTTTTAPTSGNITLNINNTGAKNIVPKGNNSVYSYGWNWAFCNNQTWLFMYNGTYFVCMNQDNNTDTKVTSVGNHYTPAKSTTKSASGGTLTDITNSSSGAQVVTGVEMDAKGHVTGVTAVALKSTESNPNLLLNPDFKINQRGATEYTGQNNYTVDRWRQYPASSVVTVVENGIKLSSKSTETYADCRQLFENMLTAGESYTITVCIDNVEYRSIRKNVQEEYQSFVAGPNNCIRIYLNIGSLYIRLMEGFDSVVINYVKLEKGTVATPFVPPDPALELVKCQRYYREIVGQFIPTIITSGMTSTYITIDNMRIIKDDNGSILSPSVYFKSNLFNSNLGARITTNAGTVIPGFTFGCNYYGEAKSIYVTASKSAHGLDRNTHVFVIDTNNPVCIDAEI